MPRTQPRQPSLHTDTKKKKLYRAPVSCQKAFLQLWQDRHNQFSAASRRCIKLSVWMI